MILIVDYIQWLNKKTGHNNRFDRIATIEVIWTVHTADKVLSKYSSDALIIEHENEPSVVIVLTSKF